jgi:alkylhydroperoxidase family enzyme
MSIKPLEYRDASPEVRAVFDDIKTSRKAGMSDAMFGEVMAVTGMANETNRLANGYRVPIDPAFDR